MFANLFTSSLLSLLLPITAFAASHGPPLLKRHHEIARRADGNVELWKRFSGARWSFYNVETGNAGSCGTFHVNSDFTVAVNVAQMNSGWCYKTIRMTYNGKSTTASISDTCPGCPYGGLDLTEGLFQFFAPSSVGIIYGDWEIVDGTDNGPPPPPPPPPPKKTTTHWVAPTTSKTPVYVPPTTSHTSTKPTSTTKKSTSTSSTKSSSSTTSTVPTPASGDNLDSLYQVFVQVGGIVAAGAKI